MSTGSVGLVPFRSDDPSRMKVWSFVEKWWKSRVSLPVYVGKDDDTEQFNISLARNRAALAAGDWQVAVIFDADTIVSAEQVQQGVKIAMETGAITYPFSERWELDEVGTAMLMDDEHSDWQSHAKRYRGQALAGCIIVRRDLWDLVHGFDPGFVGWGHEDGAFLIVCEIIGGLKHQRVPGKSLHLEHKPSISKSPSNAAYLKNKKRHIRYMRAATKDNAKELLREIRAESLDIV